MEKRTPHHDLAEVKCLIERGAFAITAVATQGAFALGLFEEDILEAILSLTRRDFYKSMTSYSDHRCWQDVYHPKTKAGIIYLKFTIQNDVLVLSFKEKQDGMPKL